MPVGVVRTPAQELAWEHAKELARRQYPYAAGPDFYRTSNGYLQEADLLSTPHIVTAPASSNARAPISDTRAPTVFLVKNSGKSGVGGAIEGVRLA
jgi:hypothetical protein